MALYLTDETSPEEIRLAADSPFVQAFKLYPAGATTNSDSGIRNLGALDPLFDAMQKAGIPLLIHGEVTDPEIDIFDREAVFIDRYLSHIVERFPTLKIVLEHVTTQEGVQFVEASRAGVAATLTAHHLLLNRNDMLVGGIKPHLFASPFSNVKCIEKHCSPLQPVGTPNSSLGQTAPRMPKTPRKRPVVALVVTQQDTPCRSTLAHLIKQENSNDSKPSPAFMAPISMDYPEMSAPLRWRNKH